MVRVHLRPLFPPPAQAFIQRMAAPSRPRSAGRQRAPPLKPATAAGGTVKRTSTSACAAIRRLPPCSAPSTPEPNGAAAKRAVQGASRSATATPDPDVTSKRAAQRAAELRAATAHMSLLDARRQVGLCSAHILLFFSRDILGPYARPEAEPTADLTLKVGKSPPPPPP